MLPPEPEQQELDDWGHAYHGPNFERLCGIKARYDRTTSSASDSRFRSVDSREAWAPREAGVRRETWSF